MIREQGAPAFQRLLSDTQEMEPSREQPRDWESFVVIIRLAEHRKGFYRPVSFMSRRCRMLADWLRQCTQKAHISISCLDLAKIWVVGVRWDKMKRGASLVAQMVKNPPDSAGDLGSIPGSGRSPGAGNGSPLQYSCLGNPMDRGAWRATVHVVTKELDTTEWLNNKMKRLVLKPRGRHFKLLLRMFKTFHNTMIYKCEQNLQSVLFIPRTVGLTFP